MITASFTPPHQYRNQLKQISNKPKLVEALVEKIKNENIELLKETQKLNEDIVREKIKATTLKQKFGDVVTEVDGSSLLVDDYKSIYELTYTRNIMLLIGTAVLGGFIAKNWSQQK